MPDYDINADGQINNTDYQQIQSVIELNDTDLDGVLSQSELDAAEDTVDQYDFNRDGKIDSTDLNQLQSNYSVTASSSSSSAVESLESMVNIEDSFNEIDSILAKFGNGTNSVEDGGYVGRESAGYESYQWYTLDSVAVATDFARLNELIQEILKKLQFLETMLNAYYNLELIFSKDSSDVKPPASISGPFAKMASQFTDYAKDMVNKIYDYVETKNDEVYQAMMDDASRRARRGGFFRRLLNSITGADKEKEAELKLQIEQSRQSLEEEMTLAAEQIMTLAIFSMQRASSIEIQEALDTEQYDESGTLQSNAASLILLSSGKSVSFVTVSGDEAGANGGESAVDLLKRIDTFDEIVTDAGEEGFKDIKRDTLVAVQMALTDIQTRQQQVLSLMQTLMYAMGTKARVISGKNFSEGDLNMAVQANSLNWGMVNTLVTQSLEQFSSLVNQMNMTYAAELAYEAAKDAASKGIIGAIVVAIIAVVAVILAAPTGGSSLMLGAKIAGAAVAGLKAGAALGQSIAYSNAAEKYPGFTPVALDMGIVNALLAEMRHFSMSNASEENKKQALDQETWIEIVATKLTDSKVQAEAAIAEINESLIVDTYDGFQGIDEVALSQARTALLDIMTAQMELFMLVKAIVNAQNFIAAVITGTGGSSLSLGAIESSMAQQNADLMMMADLKVDGLMKVVENNNRQRQMEMQAEQLMDAAISGMIGIVVMAGLSYVATSMSAANTVAGDAAVAAEQAAVQGPVSQVAQQAIREGAQVYTTTSIAIVNGLASAAPSIATSVSNIAYQSQRLSELNAYLSQIQDEMVMPQLTSAQHEQELEEKLDSEKLEERMAARFALARIHANDALNEMQVSNSLMSIGDGNMGLDPAAVSDFSTQLSQAYQEVVNALMAINTYIAARRVRDAVISGRAMKGDALANMENVLHQQYQNAMTTFSNRLSQIMEVAYAMNQQNTAETAISDSFESIAISLVTAVAQGVVSGYYAAEGANALTAEGDALMSESILANGGISALGSLYNIAKSYQIANSGFGQAANNFADKLNMTDFMDNTTDEVLNKQNSEIQKAITAMNTSLISNAGNGYVVLNNEAFSQLSIRIENIFDLQENRLELIEAMVDARATLAAAVGGTAIDVGSIFNGMKLVNGIKQQNASTMLNAMKTNVESYIQRSNAMQTAMQNMITAMVSMAIQAMLIVAEASMTSERVTVSEKGIEKPDPVRASFKQAMANKMGLDSGLSRQALIALLSILQTQGFQSIVGNMVFEAIAKDKAEGQLESSEYDSTTPAKGAGVAAAEALPAGMKGMLVAALASEQVKGQINQAKLSMASQQTTISISQMREQWSETFQQNLQNILESMIKEAFAEYSADSKKADNSVKAIRDAEAQKEKAESALVPLNDAVERAQKALAESPNDKTKQQNLSQAELKQTQAKTALANAKASLQAAMTKADQQTATAYASSLSSNPETLQPLVSALANHGQASSEASNLLMNALISSMEAKVEAMRSRSVASTTKAEEKKDLEKKMAKLEDLKAQVRGLSSALNAPAVMSIITAIASEQTGLNALKQVLNTIVENKSKDPKAETFQQNLVNEVKVAQPQLISAKLSQLTNQLAQTSQSQSNLASLNTVLNQLVALQNSGVIIPPAVEAQLPLLQAALDAQSVAPKTTQAQAQANVTQAADNLQQTIQTQLPQIVAQALPAAIPAAVMSVQADKNNKPQLLISAEEVPEAQAPAVKNQIANVQSLVNAVLQTMPPAGQQAVLINLLANNLTKLIQEPATLKGEVAQTKAIAAQSTQLLNQLTETVKPVMAQLTQTAKTEIQNKLESLQIEIADLPASAKLPVVERIAKLANIMTNLQSVTAQIQTASVAISNPSVDVQTAKDTLVNTQPTLVKALAELTQIQQMLGQTQSLVRAQDTLVISENLTKVLEEYKQVQSTAASITQPVIAPGTPVTVATPTETPNAFNPLLGQLQSLINNCQQAGIQVPEMAKVKTEVAETQEIIKATPNDKTKTPGIQAKLAEVTAVLTQALTTQLPQIMAQVIPPGVTIKVATKDNKPQLELSVPQNIAKTPTVESAQKVLSLVNAVLQTLPPEQQQALVNNTISSQQLVTALAQQQTAPQTNQELAQVFTTLAESLPDVPQKTAILSVASKLQSDQAVKPADMQIAMQALVASSPAEAAQVANSIVANAIKEPTEVNHKNAQTLVQALDTIASQTTAPISLPQVAAQLIMAKVVQQIAQQVQQPTASPEQIKQLLTILPQALQAQVRQTLPTIPDVKILETKLSDFINSNSQTNSKLIAPVLTAHITEALKDPGSQTAKNIAPFLTALDNLANQPTAPSSPAVPTTPTAPATPLVQAVAKLVQAQVAQQVVKQITETKDPVKIAEIINALPPGVQALIAQLLPQEQRAKITNLDSNTGVLELGKTIEPEQLITAIRASIAEPIAKGQLVVNAENNVKEQQNAVAELSSKQIEPKAPELSLEILTEMLGNSKQAETIVDALKLWQSPTSDQKTNQKQAVENMVKVLREIPNSHEALQYLGISEHNNSQLAGLSEQVMGALLISPFKDEATKASTLGFVNEFVAKEKGGLKDLIKNGTFKVNESYPKDPQAIEAVKQWTLTQPKIIKFLVNKTMQYDSEADKGTFRLDLKAVESVDTGSVPKVDCEEMALKTALIIVALGGEAEVNFTEKHAFVVSNGQVIDPTGEMKEKEMASWDKSLEGSLGKLVMQIKVSSTKPVEVVNSDPTVSLAKTQGLHNEVAQIEKINQTMLAKLLGQLSSDTEGLAAEQNDLLGDAVSQLPEQIRELLKQAVSQSAKDRSLSDDQLTELLINNPQIAQAVIQSMAQQFASQNINFSSATQDPVTGDIYIGEEQKPLEGVAKEIVTAAFSKAFEDQSPIQQSAVLAQFAAEQLEKGVNLHVPEQRMQALVKQAHQYIPELLIQVTEQLQSQQVVNNKEIVQIASLQKQIAESDHNGDKFKWQAEIATVLVKANTRAGKTGKGLTSIVADSLATVHQKISALQNTNWSEAMAPKQMGMPEIAEELLAQVRELGRKDVPAPIVLDNQNAVRDTQLNLYEMLKKQLKVKLEDSDYDALEALKKFGPKSEEKLPTLLAKSAQQLVALMEKAQAEQLVEAKVLASVEGAADLLRGLTAPEQVASVAPADLINKVLKEAERSLGSESTDVTPEAKVEQKAKNIVAMLGGRDKFAPQTTFKVIKQVMEEVEKAVKDESGQGIEYDQAVLARASQLIIADEPKFGPVSVNWANKINKNAISALTEEINVISNNGRDLASVNEYLQNLPTAVKAELKPLVTKEIQNLTAFEGVENLGPLNPPSPPMAGSQGGLNVDSMISPSILFGLTEIEFLRPEVVTVSEKKSKTLTISNLDNSGSKFTVNLNKGADGVTAIVLQKISASGEPSQPHIIFTPQRLIALQSAFNKILVTAEMDEKTTAQLTEYIDLIPELAMENAKVLPDICTKEKAKLDASQKVLDKEIAMFETESNLKTVNASDKLADIAMLNFGWLPENAKQEVVSKTQQTLSALEKAGSVEEQVAVCNQILSNPAEVFVSFKKEAKATKKEDPFRKALIAAHRAADKALAAV